MKPDPKHERMGIAEIRLGLDELGKQLNSDASLLAPFQIACAIYENLIPHPFAPDEWVFQNARLQEAAMFVAAAMDLVRSFRLVDRKNQLKELREHVRLIGPGFFGIAATFSIQQAKGSVLRDRLAEIGYAVPTDQVAADAARKTIELMVGIAAMTSFDQVELENPNESKASDPNPDIIVEHDGSRYGVACKSLASSNGTNFLSRIEEGIVQLSRAIDAGKVDRQRGVVLLDISALLNHQRLYNGPGAEQTQTPIGPAEALISEMNAALVRLFGRGPVWSELLPPIFAQHPLPPGILIYGHSLLICHDERGGISPVYQKAIFLGFGNDVDSIKPFCRRLNDAIHGQPRSR